MTLYNIQRLREVDANGVPTGYWVYRLVSPSYKIVDSTRSRQPIAPKLFRVMQAQFNSKIVLDRMGIV
jgi:hypothetical protein